MMKMILISFFFGFTFIDSNSIAANEMHQDRTLPETAAAPFRLDDSLVEDVFSLNHRKNDDNDSIVQVSVKEYPRLNDHRANVGDSDLLVLFRRSTASRLSSPSDTSISAATPASSSSKSNWSELRHQKSWTSTSQSSSSDASLTNCKKKENKNTNLHRDTKMTKRPKRIVTSGRSKPSGQKSQNFLGDLAIDGHSSDSSVDSAEYNSMLHKARQLGFNIRTDGALTSWPNVPHHSIQESSSRSATNRSRRRSSRRSTNPIHRSRSSSSHSSSGSDDSASSFIAHPA